MIEHLMDRLRLRNLTKGQLAEELKMDLKEGKITKSEFDSIMNEIYTSMR